MAIPLPSSPRCDHLFWPFEKNGDYSIKSGYKLSTSKRLAKVNKSASSSFSIPQSLWCFLWNVRVLPKVKKFLWQCNNVEALPVKWALWKRKCLASSVCSICGLDVETIEHLLVLCPWVKEVWRNYPLKIQYNRAIIGCIES